MRDRPIRSRDLVQYKIAQINALKEVIHNTHDEEVMNKRSILSENLEKVIVLEKIIVLEKTQAQEEAQVPENKEISMFYAYTREVWDHKI